MIPLPDTWARHEREAREKPPRALRGPPQSVLPATPRRETAACAARLPVFLHRGRAGPRLVCSTRRLGRHGRVCGRDRVEPNRGVSRSGSRGSPAALFHSAQRHSSTSPSSGSALHLPRSLMKARSQSTCGGIWAPTSRRPRRNGWRRWLITRSPFSSAMASRTSGVQPSTVDSPFTSRPRGRRHPSRSTRRFSPR